ncbi:MAG: T9SS type A sorting domain-containing protein, partial [Bacteroidales bacterium]
FQNTININPYGTTNFTASGATTQIILSKYSKSGQLIWGKTMGGTPTSEAPHGVECDAAKNIYMTGYFGSTTQAGPQNADFNPNGGGTIATQGNEDCFAAKYDQNGNYLWAFGLGNTAANTQERAWDIAVEASGNLYIGGGYHGTMNFNPLGTALNKILPDTNAGLFFAKYNTNGINQWVVSINAGCTSVFTEAYITFDLDNSGNLYVAGNFRGSNVDFNPNGSPVTLTSSGLTDIFIAKYNAADGTLLWVKKIGGTAAEVVSPGALRCDHNGNPYFTGRLSGTGSVDFNPSATTVNVTNSALFLTSFDATGNLRFANGFNSGTGDGGHRISFDSENNVYLAGWMNGTVSFGTGINITANSPTADAFLAKFTNSGTVQWAFSFGGTGATANNICAGLIVDQENNPIITGQLYGTNANVNPLGTNPLNLSSIGNNDCFVIKYDKDGQLWNNQSMLANSFSFENKVIVFPNPTKDKFEINNTSNNLKLKQLEIFNISGKRLDCIELNASNRIIDLFNYNSGVYILKFTSDNQSVSFLKLVKQ